MELSTIVGFMSKRVLSSARALLFLTAACQGFTCMAQSDAVSAINTVSTNTLLGDLMLMYPANSTDVQTHMLIRSQMTFPNAFEVVQLFHSGSTYGTFCNDNVAIKAYYAYIDEYSSYRFVSSYKIPLPTGCGLMRVKYAPTEYNSSTIKLMNDQFLIDLDFGGCIAFMCDNPESQSKTAGIHSGCKICLVNAADCSVIESFNANIGGDIIVNTWEHHMTGERHLDVYYTNLNTTANAGEFYYRQYIIKFNPSSTRGVDAAPETFDIYTINGDKREKLAEGLNVIATPEGSRTVLVK